MKRSLLSFFVIQVMSFSVLQAQSYVSTQSHNGKVTSIVASNTGEYDSKMFFSAGADGFLVKWNDDDSGEHYQISDLSIGKVIKNPVSNELAIYETDSLTMNKITVLDWNNFTKKFSKRFKDSVTCAAYSEKGTYLIVGTTAVNGIYIINARTGIVSKNIKAISSIITMAKTGESEKTAVMYSPSGFLYYYDFTKDKIIAKFQTQSDLEQTVLFGTGNLQNRFFAGTKNNSIYIIDALNGKIITQCPASTPLIVTGISNEEEGLYYISSSGRGYSLKLISYTSLEESIKKKTSYGIQDGIMIKSLFGLRSGDSFTAIAKNHGTIFAGTASGDIYTMPDIAESEAYTLYPITEKTFKDIYDIASDSSNCYCLTEDAVYTSNFGINPPSREKIALNTGHTNFFIYSDSIILWSKNTRKDVLKVTPSESYGEEQTIKLFTPTAKLKVVRPFGNKILYIQGNNSVSIYDMETGQSREIYTGISLEDAVLVNDTVYISKAALSPSDTAMVSVNISTGETVPVKTKGNIVFSLSHDNTDSQNIYGILMIRQKDDSYTTEVFSYNINTKFLKSLISLNDEDSSAFTLMNGTSQLYTNIGKNQVYEFNTKTTRNSTYKRAASIPVKIATTNAYTAILNRDGSISVYNQKTHTAVSNWYITVDNNWWEF